MTDNTGNPTTLDAADRFDLLPAAGARGALDGTGSRRAPSQATRKRLRNSRSALCRAATSSRRSSRTRAGPTSASPTRATSTIRSSAAWQPSASARASSSTATRSARGDGRRESRPVSFPSSTSNSPSSDLVNADYIVGIVVGYRHGPFSALGRLFHQSSHLGDEYVLSDEAEYRVNLSYQAVDLRLSYEFFGDVLRLYVGGEDIFEREPATLKPLSLQSGLEFRSPWPGRARRSVPSPPPTSSTARKTTGRRMCRCVRGSSSSAGSGRGISSSSSNTSRGTRRTASSTRTRSNISASACISIFEAPGRPPGARIKEREPDAPITPVADVVRRRCLDAHRVRRHALAGDARHGRGRSLVLQGGRRRELLLDRRIRRADRQAPAPRRFSTIRSGKSSCSAI